MDDLFTYPWPSWKFGLKKEDLFSTLDSQYNTFSFRIQDPQAFHHDVCEISNVADTTEELHRMLAERREKRLAELQSSLMSLSMEIIGNPRLMDSEHWDYACQLFRTRSFDSLVRFFGSYLPDSSDECCSKSVISSRSSSLSWSDASTAATSHSIDDISLPIFGKAADPIIIHDEPEQIDDFYDDIYATDPKAAAQLAPTRPLSPATTEADSHDAGSTRAPSPSLSYSESETAGFTLRSISRRNNAKADNKVVPGYATPDSSVCGESSHAESSSTLAQTTEFEEELDQEAYGTQTFDDDEFLSPIVEEDDYSSVTKNTNTPSLTNTTSRKHTTDLLDSETSTPKQDSVAGSYLEYKSAFARRSPSLHRRSVSPEATTRRSPEEATSKIQKPLSHATRIRMREKKQTAALK